ncbi:MAG: DEAD/DEAH box helicase [bacterium]
MKIDRHQKKKRKRDQRRKARRMQMERNQRDRKSRFFSYNAEEAFFYNNYELALKWAIKSLRLDPRDDHIRDIAIQCAALLNKEATIYNLLLQGWEKEALRLRKDYLFLGRMAFSQKDYRLAKEVFQGLVAEAVPMESPLTKTQLKEAERYLKRLDMLEHAIQPIPRRSVPAPSPGSKEEAAKPQTPQVEEKEKRKIEDSSAEIHLKPKITFEVDAEPILTAIKKLHRANVPSLEMTLKAYKLSFRTSYDQLLCLPVIRNVQSLWYQEETARKVMKYFRGRAILADEVGLGKTIEACMVLKEYLLRGLVRTALILTPSNLVHQWQEELLEKFQLTFVSSNDPLFRQDPERFWQSPLVLASIHTAKSKRHFDFVTSRSYDMIIVDEAHHLKNRATLNWKLVNAIPKTYLLLLTATPVQNNLEELYNLVTLLSPGHLKTRKTFKEEFVTRGNPTDPQNREKLRQLLKEVMLRNTRSVTQLHLPPRFATTVKVSPSQPEETFYQAISEFIAEQAKLQSDGLTRMALQKLLEAAGSSHIAALRVLENVAARNQNGISKYAKEILAMGREIRIGAKTQQVLELLHALSDQRIIFVNYLATLEYLRGVLEEQKIPHVVFQGSMTTAQKQAAIDTFRKGCPVLLATGTGGEGHNLQFCHTMINYDLPWNPMQIEQRIGRIHRIGQDKEVQVYNFCAAGSLEDHILEVLDRKINMFELVVGEIDMILGRLKGEQEFSELVYDIWIKNSDEAKRREAFNALASRLKRARMAYEKSKELDEKLFQEDFGV